MFLKLFKNYGIVIIWASIVLILSGMPVYDLNKDRFINIPHLDKIIHFAMYYILSFLIIYSNHTNKNNNFTFKKTSTISFIISFAYGITIEIMQHYIFISRGFDILDIIANTSGILISILFYKKIFMFMDKILQKFKVTRK